MNQHEKLNYVEFAAKDLESTKAFFQRFLAGNLLTMGLNTQLFQMKV